MREKEEEERLIREEEARVIRQEEERMQRLLDTLSKYSPI